MSLARSLTTRMRARFEDPTNAGALPNRALSTKVAGARNQDKNIDRRLISLPVELLSTSNAQAYEAPDIKNMIEPRVSARAPAHTPLSPMVRTQALSPVTEQQLTPQTATSSASSTRSWEDGLVSPALTSTSSITSNEISREPSPANCDASPMSKSFFLDHKVDPVKQGAEVVVREISSPTSSPTKNTPERTQSSTPATVAIDELIPAIPTRSATHTKATHQRLARQRSQSQLATLRQASPRESTDPSTRASSTTPSLTPSLTPSTTPSASSEPKIDEVFAIASLPQLPPVSPMNADLFSSAKAALDHPFGAELAKVNELVEELVTRDVGIVDEETQYLIDNGFRRFGASDYILEIQPLFFRAYGGEPALPVISEWI